MWYLNYKLNSLLKTLMKLMFVAELLQSSTYTNKTSLGQYHYSLVRGICTIFLCYDRGKLSLNFLCLTFKRRTEPIIDTAVVKFLLQ